MRAQVGVGLLMTLPPAILDGSDRFALHLGLKLARLAGLLTTDVVERPASSAEADAARSLKLPAN